MPLSAGSGQAAHDVPQEPTLVLDTQGPLPAGQRWKPGLQVKPHVLLVHTATALGSDDAGQVTQDDEVPHCMVLSFGKQPLVAGHMCVPAPQTSPHIAFTQAWPAAQGVQSTPLM